MTRALLAVACSAQFVLSACADYAVPAGTVVMTPASFDRSFSAAAGAMRDEGLAITVQDPARGVVVGNSNGSVVMASIGQQADGSVQVRFDASDSRDPVLLQRISRSYDRRMGR